MSGECQGEMMDYRRMLMEDFSLSPEIVLHCRSEIEGHCSGLHRKGRTLHCLMRVGRGDMGAIDPNCQRAVSRPSESSSGQKHSFRVLLCCKYFQSYPTKVECFPLAVVEQSRALKAELGALKETLLCHSACSLCSDHIYTFF